MQPQPLFRIFAHPALDHRGHGLHRAGNVDLSRRIAHRLDLFGEFGAEAMVGEADDAHAVDRAFDLTHQAGQRRIGLGLAAEEGDLGRLPPACPS